MQFQPLCNKCCSNLNGDAVFTSCRHIVCTQCKQSVQPNLCPICNCACKTIAFNNPSFPVQLKELMLYDHTSALKKSIESYQFQHTQQKLATSCRQELMQQKIEQNRSLKRTVIELESKLALAIQDLKRIKTPPFSPSSQIQETSTRQTSHLYPRLGLHSSPVVGPRIQSGEDPKSIVINRVFGKPFLPATNLSQLSRRPVTPVSVSLSMTPRSTMPMDSGLFSHSMRPPTATSQVPRTFSSQLSQRGKDPLDSQLPNRSQQPPPNPMFSSQCRLPQRSPSTTPRSVMSVGSASYSHTTRPPTATSLPRANDIFAASQRRA